MAIGLVVRIRATIRLVGKQVTLIVVRAESTLLLFHGVHLKTNSHLCGNAYLIRNYLAHLVEFRTNAAIDHVVQGYTIVHAHVIFVRETLDLGARHTLCHCIVPHINRVVHLWYELGCVAQGQRVHLRAQTKELDYWIVRCLVLNVAQFSGLEIRLTTSKAGKVPRTYLAEISLVRSLTK